MVRPTNVSQTFSKLWTQRPGRRVFPWLRPTVGLGTKMAMIVVMGLMSLIGLFAYLGTAALNENIQRTLQERVVLAQTAARNIDHSLIYIEHVLTDTAARCRSDAERRFVNVECVHRRLYFLATRAFLVDRTGHAVAAYPSMPGTVSFSQFMAVSAVLEGQLFAVSRYRRPLEPLEPAAIAAVPVWDEHGTVTGALVISIDLTGPGTRLFTDPIGLGETGYMDLVDRRGVILASTRAERIGHESDHRDSLAAMIRDRRQVVSRCHDCHTALPDPAPRREVLAFAPLERAQWGITVRQSEAEVFASIYRLQLRIFALMVLAITGALILVYLTTRSVITPVQALTAAARRIAAGDLDTPIKATARDEIGTLAQSFDAMRARLKKSIDEIQELNRVLDARVQERTAALAAVAAENVRLFVELQRKEQLRSELLHRVIGAQEEERKRISRELHDETCQILTGLAYAVDSAIELADAPEMQQQLERMRLMTETALDGVHRIIFDLRPAMLDHLGLVPALQWYAETCVNGQGIHFTIHHTGNVRRLPPPIETTLFRVVQEAITNIARHSKAQHAELVFDFADDQIEVRVTDDGVGFDPAGVASAWNGQRGLGLMGMEERMSTIGGEFDLCSAPGEGTTIRLSVPIKNTTSLSGIEEQNHGENSSAGGR